MNFLLNRLVEFDISGKTVVSMGTGEIGKVLAKILRGFDVNVIACVMKIDVIHAKTFGTLLNQGDIISIHFQSPPNAFHVIFDNLIKTE